MRSLAVVVLAVTIVAAAAGSFSFEQERNVKYADKEFLTRQKDLFGLLRFVYQNDWNSELTKFAKSFDYKTSYDMYTDKEVPKKFYTFWEYGMLPRGEVFSVYDDLHREQAIALFNMFYYAKDWESFYKTCAWARYYVNEGMFVYALTLAVTHRKDLSGFVMPAPYEIYPYYFVNQETIQKAQQYKMQGYYGMKKIDDAYTVVIPMNYTGWYMHMNVDQKITYFTEDVGLNSYYYYFHIDYPFWMTGKEFGLNFDRRGELYLFEHQQLLARYYMERLSNDLGHIPTFSWYAPLKTGYYPALTYYNGNAFPVRQNFYNFFVEEFYMDLEEVTTYERRIRDVIDYGFMVLPSGEKVDFTKPDAIEYLGNMIQCNPDSPNTRYYRYVIEMMKMLFGASVQTAEEYKLIPGVLEHYETATRDPVFYQIFKRVISYYWQFKKHLTPYTYEELYFPGVKVDDIDVEKLVTYFDKFDLDITNAVDMEPADLPKGAYKSDAIVIKARTTRLNHKPFSYKMSVTSDKSMKVAVRTFLAPKYDEFGNLYQLTENRKNFYELDYFTYDLLAGKNTLVRNSAYFAGYANDRTSFYTLYKTAMAAYKGDEKFPLDMTEAHCGFPNRLMLPKGKKGGMPFQFFAIVTPFYKPQTKQYTGYDERYSCGVGSGARYMDSLPFGFPFDRRINENYFKVPNMYFEDVFIFHRKDVDVTVDSTTPH